MLLAMMFSCEPVTEDNNSNNSENNTTQEGDNNTGSNTGGNQESDTVVLNGCTYTKDMKKLWILMNMCTVNYRIFRT